MELKRVSAKEARNMSRNTEVTLKRIYKFISEAAKENSRSILFNFMDPDEEAVKDVTKDLTDNGYTVDQKNEDNCIELTIKW